MITMPTATTKTTTPTRTGLSITGPTTVEHWRESFLDRIAITGALLDEADRERLGAWIAADALELLCPAATNEGGWLAFLTAHFEERAGAPHGITRVVATRIVEAISEARAGFSTGLTKRRPAARGYGKATRPIRA
jgi:hypothetical protein